MELSCAWFPARKTASRQSRPPVSSFAARATASVCARAAAGPASVSADVRRVRHAKLLRNRAYPDKVFSVPFKWHGGQDDGVMVKVRKAVSVANSGRLEDANNNSKRI